MKLHRNSLKDSMVRAGILCLFLLLSLLVSVPLSAQSKLPPQVHQRLMSYINTYDSTKLLADPLVKPQLARLMGPQVQHLKTNLNVAGSIGVSDGMLTLSGNAPHRGMEENGFLGVSLYNGDVVAVLLTNGTFEIYGKQATKYEYLPYPVRQWVEATWARLQLGIKDPPNVVMHPAR